MYVWHDGEFPFDDEHDENESPRRPCVIHHGNGNDFIALGKLLLQVEEEGQKLQKEQE